MANPTNPFNWQMPTASDLVTDLPADFETFGQAVATSMADLLGGTTDQVLAKNSNTDMDFKWVTSDDANAIQNSIVDAIRYADGVTTTTPQLAAELRKLNRNVEILPNALDTTDEHWVASPQQRDVFTFGWVGGLTHSNDIMIISDAIARICDEYGDRVRFVINFSIIDIF